MDIWYPPPPWDFQWRSMGWVLIFSVTSQSTFGCCMDVDGQVHWGYAKPGYWFCHSFVKYIKLINISSKWYLLEWILQPCTTITEKVQTESWSGNVIFLYCHSDSWPFQATPLRPLLSEFNKEIALVIYLLVFSFCVMLFPWLMFQSRCW